MASSGINKFALYLEQAQFAAEQQKRQEEATRAYNEKVKGYFSNLKPV
jgi:hypothetical protein